MPNLLKKNILERVKIEYRSKSINMFLFVISVLLIMLFRGSIDVRAGTIDANGYTLAEDLSGMSYALLTDDNILYVFRSSDSLSLNDKYTYTKNGVSYTGIIQNLNFEEGSNTIGGGATKIVFLDDIKPNRLSFAESDVVTIEGLKEHVDTRNITDMQDMFYNCTKLETMDVSGFKTSKVTNMSRMFEGCSSLKELDVSGFSTGGVLNMHAMFEKCSSLTELDVSHFDTKNVTTIDYMFQNCTGLTKIDVSNFDTKNVTNMGSVFEYCTSVTSLDVSNFDTSHVTNMWGMFNGCTSLVDLDVSHFD